MRERRHDRGTRILLVEDEPAIAEVVAFALTSEGFSVEWRSLAA